MVILKKVQSSSLTEVIISAIIILVVFFIAMGSVKNVLVSHAKSQKAMLERHLDILEYRLKYKRENIKDTIIVERESEWNVLILQAEKEEEVDNVKYIIEVYDKEGERVAIRKFVKEEDEKF